jgi:hypothetical protein
VHPHAAGPEVLEAFQSGDREGFDPDWIAGTARDVNLGRTNRRRHATVDVAFQKTNCLLSRRVIAEGDVDVGINEAGKHGCTVRVDDDIAPYNEIGRGGTDLYDLAILHDDRIAAREGGAPIAGRDRS